MLIFCREACEEMESLGEGYGVTFSNADYIDACSKVIGNHNEILRAKRLISEIPEGDVFEMVLRRYFICTPTMLIKKEIFDRIGGYDETLAYEDFDFWVRSSRYYKYAYIDEVLMQKRKLPNSMSAMRYKHHLNGQLKSVFTVCQKAYSLCKTMEERNALLARLAYEHRQCMRHGAYDLANDYLNFIQKIGGSTVKLKFIGRLISLGLDRSRV